MRAIATVACLLGALGVGLGAFGAHALRDAIAPDRLATWQTASTYHLLHAVALLAAACSGKEGLRRAGWLMTFGVVLFSGSLYLLAATGVRALGAIAPIGGGALIAAWIWLAWAWSRQSD